MIEASSFVDAARNEGFKLFSGVPCSYLTAFINHVISDSSVRYVAAANEGDAVAIAAGSELGGRPAVAMFQNSGLGNAVSPLTSLTHVFEIPILLIVTLRGEPGGAPDEPQHSLMGAITLQLLETMQIPWAYFPTDESAIEGALRAAVTQMSQSSRPYAFVMRKGTVRPSPATAAIPTKPVSQQTVPQAAALHNRREILQALQRASNSNDRLLATTGYTGRELFHIGDRREQLYMVGSMGCASSLGLGLALACPDKRIIVIDGDGAALMRLGAMTSIGFERPDNLLHVMLDNGVHESTGSQSTVSGSIDFCEIALACGYPRVRRIATPDAVIDELASGQRQLTFIHIPILPGVPDDLGRPTIQPSEVARRIRGLSRTE